MTNSKFHIISLAKERLLVVLKSWEGIEYYLDELQSEILSVGDISCVYFDLLMKNGPRNRYYKATVINGKLSLHTFQKVDVDAIIEKKSNQFFANNIDMLNESVLTKAQKFLYKRQLQLI